MKVSMYESVKKTREGSEVRIIAILDAIKSGKWEDLINNVRTAKNKEDRTAAKLKLPAITVSGVFSERKEDGLTDHSNLISIDFDEVQDIEELENKLKEDKYIFSSFRSASGGGVCAIIKIKGQSHKESFASLQEYFLNQYGKIIDPAPSNVASARYISFDPNLYLKEDSTTWTKTLSLVKTAKAHKSYSSIITTQNDFEYILKQIEESRTDITGGYAEWLQICFAISKEHGAGGFEYFDRISQFSPSYDFDKCQEQYNACLKRNGVGGRHSNMSSVFYHAKNAGINISNPDTQKIKVLAKHAKNRRATQQGALETAIGIQPSINQDLAKGIIQDVYKAPNEALNKDDAIPILEEIKHYLKSNHKIRLNDMSDKIEIDGKVVTDRMINSIWGGCCEAMGKAVKKNYVQDLINSDLVYTAYHPIKDYISKNKDIECGGAIDALINCVEFSEENGENIKGLIKKWFVSWFSFLADDYSPLVLVFTGKQGSGKSWFFQNLLPADLSDMYAETNLSQGKDDLMLMIQKLVLLNDEFGGKTVSEAKDFKELVSKNYITYRKPYGREDITKKRMAIFCGSSNEKEVISDMTGNRRIIALEIKGINWDAYNAIDKSAVFMDAYNLFKEGFNWKVLKEDIEVLNIATEMHVSKSIEEQLILAMFRPSNSTISNSTFMQSAEIHSRILATHKGIRISQNKLGRALNALGFKSLVKSIEGQKIRGYYIIGVDGSKVTESVTVGYGQENTDPPF